MEYFENDLNGIIVAISVDAGQTEITQERYESIQLAFSQKPAQTDTTGFRLKTDLTWEAYDVPEPEPHSPTAEDKAEAYDILMGDVVCAGMTPQEKARQLKPLIEKPLFSLMTLNGGK